jgi:hypothetical protein
MQNRAVDIYHDLLSDRLLREASLDKLKTRLQTTGLTFGGRPLVTSVRPVFISEEQYARISYFCRQVWSAIRKIRDLVLIEESLWDELGLTAGERALIAVDPGYDDLSPSSRFDAFLSKDGFSFVELNGECPTGIGYSDIALSIFDDLPVMAKFRESFAPRSIQGASLLLRTLIKAYSEFCPTSERMPLIAIVDLPNLPTQREFEILKELFTAQKCETIICTPMDLEFNNNELSCRGRKIDLVYRRILVNEYLPIMDIYHALASAYRSRMVCVVNSFRSKILHKKSLFALLTQTRFQKIFTENERGAIAGSVPWTRRVREEKTDRPGGLVDLPEYIRSNRERLVLKPNDEYGGRGILLGWETDQKAWEESLDHAIRTGDYIVQMGVVAHKEVFPLISGDGIEMRECLVDIDPLLFNGEPGSLFARLSTGSLSNVTSGAGMVPVYLI